MLVKKVLLGYKKRLKIHNMQDGFRTLWAGFFSLEIKFHRT